MPCNNILGLDPPVFNAGGTCKEWKEFMELLETRIPVVEVGSITAGPRQGNPEPRIHIQNGDSLNSVGLANEGIAWYRKELPGMVTMANRQGKGVLLNIAAEFSQDYEDLAALGAECQVDGIVVNMSCPNVEQGNVFCFHPESVQEVLTRVKRVAPGLLIIPKISPCTDLQVLTQLAKLFIDQEVAAVAACNTIPGCYDTDSQGNPVIGTGTAGGAGEQLFRFALGQVLYLRQLLPDEIGIIGIGGINSGLRAWQFLASGANAVAIHTAARSPRPPYPLDPTAFNRIIGELEAIQSEKGEA